MLVNFFFFSHILFCYYPPSSSMGARRKLKKKKKDNNGVLPPSTKKVTWVSLLRRCSHTQRMPLTRLASPSRRNKHLLPSKTSGKINVHFTTLVPSSWVVPAEDGATPCRSSRSGSDGPVHRTSRGGKQRNTWQGESASLSPPKSLFPHTQGGPPRAADRL